jgi:eight-cysteine-cluster-containing protein
LKSNKYLNSQASYLYYEVKLMRLAITIGFIITAIILVSCSKEITNYDECVAAGHNVIQTEPAQCEANGKTFTEETTLSEAEAREIAKASRYCRDVGPLKDTEPTYTPNSKTWWFDLDAVKPGCNPACVVFSSNKGVEVNWRCTGLLPPEGEPNTEEFCGSSTYAACKGDLECNPNGCSGQVCAGKDEQIMTDCMARSCYNAAEYNLECSCLDNKCQWN